MNYSKSFTFFVCAAALMGAAACGDDDGDDGDSNNGGTAGTAGSGGTGGGAGSGGTGGTAGTGGSGGTGGSDGGMQMAQLRVAHLSPNAPPVDVCVSSGGAFSGPVLKSLGDTDGLAYSQVTSYVELPAGTYSVRIVAPNAANCTTALAGLPDVTGVALSAGADYTAAAIGMLNATGNDEPFAVTLFADDNSPANASKGYVRFIHASPDTPNVDVGTGSSTSFSAVWTNVPFSEVGQVGGEDYLETDPLTDATISARATGTTADALVIPGVDLPAGAVATAFAIGNLDGTPAPLKVLLCVDTAATATCSVVP